MLFRGKINSLTEDELQLLYYILNDDFKASRPIDETNICWFRTDILKLILEQVETRLTEEGKVLVRSIKEKLI